MRPYPLDFVDESRELIFSLGAVPDETVVFLYGTHLFTGSEEILIIDGKVAFA